MSSEVPLRIAVLLTLAPSVVAVAAIVAAELRDWRSKKHEREMRLRDERIAAYRKLLAATTTAHVERSGVDALTAAHAEIALLASTDEIDRAAAEVKLAYWQKQKRSYRETQDLDAPASESAQALRKAEAARNRFLTLAWEELGIEGRSLGYRDLEGEDPGEELPEPQEPSSPQP